MANVLPIVDFGSGSVDVKEEDIKPGDLRKAGKKIVEALRTIGFCYLTHHGVPESFLDDFRESSREFFMLPTDFKMKYRRQTDKADYLGWVGLEEESTNPERPGDLKQSFNAIPSQSWTDWPEDVVPEFRRHCDQFFHTALPLAFRVLNAIALELGLPEDNDLVKCHSLVGNRGNVTQLRTLYYPELATDRELKENQIRLGEHFDFGTLTLLFQDLVGGLEVCNTDGDWIPATPIPGTVLINIGEVMQRWTSDDLIATKHRIMMPAGKGPAPERQSMAFFLVPDDTAKIECLTGSNKYPPRTLGEFMSERMHSIYAKK